MYLQTWWIYSQIYVGIIFRSDHVASLSTVEFTLTHTSRLHLHICFNICIQHAVQLQFISKNKYFISLLADVRTIYNYCLTKWRNHTIYIKLIRHKLANKTLFYLVKWIKQGVCRGVMSFGCLTPPFGLSKIK